ncbi:MAG: hypothetical protein HY548_10050, partial [Elusimicrobia bacterium]|nr:hypothetical protein [Elusimicrobiota bacterium]
MRVRRQTRWVALGIAGVFLCNNVLLANAVESNFWKQRRQAADEFQKRSEPPSTLLAKLNSSQIQDLSSALPSFSPALTGLSSSAKEPLGPMKTLVPQWLQSAAGPYGEIHEIQIPGGKAPDRYILHIQDIHEIYEAQKNIAALIDRLAASVGAGGAETSAPRVVVGLEGAEGPFDFSLFRNFTSTGVVESAADAMLRAGLMSGSEYYGTTAQNPAILWGVEETESYRRNIQAFKDSLFHQHADDELLAASERILGMLKNTIYSPELRDLDHQTTRFAKNEISLGEYIAFLADRSGGDVWGPNIGLFLKALRMEKEIDFGKAEGERVRLMEALAKTLPSAELERLLKNSVDFRFGRITYRQFYEGFQNLCSSHGVHLRDFPHMEVYIQYAMTAGKIEKGNLLVELERLEEKVLSRHIKSDREKLLAALAGDFRLLAKLNTFSLMSKEWSALQKREKEIGNVPGRFDVLTKASGIAADLNFLAGISGLYKRHEAFYAAAEQRNHDMVEHLIEKMEAMEIGGKPGKEKVKGRQTTPPLARGL